jgi:hypothetical protein
MCLVLLPACLNALDCWFSSWASFPSFKALVCGDWLCLLLHLQSYVPTLITQIALVVSSCLCMRCTKDDLYKALSGCPTLLYELLSVPVTTMASHEAKMAVKENNNS